MASKFLPILALSIFLVLISCLSISSAGKVVCYWGSWSSYRKQYKYTVDNIPATKCTHVIYSFAKLDAKTNTIVPGDMGLDINQKGYERFVGLKKKNPKLKTMIAIGGWSEGVKKYSAMASRPETRNKFVSSVVKFLNKHKFDGLDVDWEYPAAADRGGKPEDKKNFVSLMTELSKELKPSGKLLTMAVVASGDKIDKGYDIPRLVKVVDQIHVMTYDMRGSWDKKTDVHTPLKSRSVDKGTEKEVWNVQDALKGWEKRGAPKSKLIVGLAFYARTFTLADPARNGFKAPAKGDGNVGIDGSAGTLAYFECCSNVQQKGWKRVYDQEGQAVYAYKGDQWAGFDDEQSITAKLDWIRANQYGGAMVWSIEQDDFTGVCGKKNPLLTLMFNKMAK